MRTHTLFKVAVLTGLLALSGCALMNPLMILVKIIK
ncbi:hypothetical protein ACMVO0_005053, partial [Salmonella enterica subsp. enterica serovar Agona]